MKNNGGSKNNVLFAPYPNPQDGLSRSLDNNFADTAGWPVDSNRQIIWECILGLMNLDDNSQTLDPVFKRIIPFGRFSAGKAEEELKKLEGTSGADSFKKRLEIAEDPNSHLFEPMPIAKRKRPNEITDMCS